MIARVKLIKIKITQLVEKESLTKYHLILVSFSFLFAVLILCHSLTLITPIVKLDLLQPHEIALMGFAINSFDKIIKPKFNRQSQDREWHSIKDYLASTDDLRGRVITKLGIDKGEYILALLSTNCEDCDQVARQLNRLKDKNIKAIAVVASSSAEANAWRVNLRLNYTVISVSSKELADLGAVLLPTIVMMKDAKAIQATDNVEVVLNARR